MKKKMKSRSHKCIINRPRTRLGHKYSKYKKCLSMLMLISIKQHLSNIWGWIHEKVKGVKKGCIGSKWVNIWHLRNYLDVFFKFCRAALFFSFFLALIFSGFFFTLFFSLFLFLFLPDFYLITFSGVNIYILCSYGDKMINDNFLHFLSYSRDWQKKFRRNFNLSLNPVSKWYVCI